LNPKKKAPILTQNNELLQHGRGFYAEQVTRVCLLLRSFSALQLSPEKMTAQKYESSFKENSSRSRKAEKHTEQNVGPSWENSHPRLKLPQ
jgi:hypothetical protein